MRSPNAPALTTPATAAVPVTRSALGFAIAVLVIGVLALELGFRFSPLAGALAAESLYARKARAFDASEGADVAITGDSRILHGVVPEVLANRLARSGERPRVYNAGLSGAPPMAQLAWVRRFLTHPGKRPSLVVVGISPYMFSSRIAREPSRESLTTLWRLRDLPAAIRAGAGTEEVGEILASNLFETVRLRPRLLELLFRGRQPGAPADPGVDGYLAMYGQGPEIQKERAHHRGLGYRTEMWKPEAHFGNEQVGYFLELLRELRAAGVRTVVINTPSASGVDVAYGPNSLYDEHLASVKARAGEYGAQFLDLKAAPGMTDADFADGDHLTAAGAAKFSALLAEALSAR